MDKLAKELRNCFEAGQGFDEAMLCIGAGDSIFYGDLETVWWDWEVAFAEGHGWKNPFTKK